MGNFKVAPRSLHTQQLNYFRAVSFFRYAVISARTAKFPLGTLPAGAIVTGTMVKSIDGIQRGDDQRSDGRHGEGRRRDPRR